jgi:hypothetical protein
MSDDYDGDAGPIHEDDFYLMPQQPELDARFEAVLERFIPTPQPKNGAEMERHEAYRAFDASLAKLGGSEEREQGYQGIEEHKRLEAFVAIRQTLEDAGVPFLRATSLAERCLAALLSKGAL